MGASGIEALDDTAEKSGEHRVGGSLLLLMLSMQQRTVQERLIRARLRLWKRGVEFPGSDGAKSLLPTRIHRTQNLPQLLSLILTVRDLLKALCGGHRVRHWLSSYTRGGVCRVRVLMVIFP